MGSGCFAAIQERLKRPAKRLAQNNADALAVGSREPSSPAKMVTLKTDADVTQYLNKYYPLGRFSGNLENLNKDHGAMVAIGRGLMKVAKSNAQGPVQWPDPPTAADIDTQIAFAKNNQGVGACNFVAAELGSYLGSNANYCNLTDIPLVGTHAIAWKQIDGVDWIVDGTWRQYKGKLGFKYTPSETILVGTLESIKDYLTDDSGGISAGAVALLKFYSKMTNGTRTPQWLQDLKPKA